VGRIFYIGERGPYASALLALRVIWNDPLCPGVKSTSTWPRL